VHGPMTCCWCSSRATRIGRAAHAELLNVNWPGLVVDENNYAGTSPTCASCRYDGADSCPAEATVSAGCSTTKYPHLHRLRRAPISAATDLPRCAAFNNLPPTSQRSSGARDDLAAVLALHCAARICD
jgi:hypothetical protein